MEKRRYALAVYNDDEEGFLCQICQEQHGSSLVYEDWEIIKHLKDPHRFNLNKKERMHRIVGWNDKFEKSYIENKNRALHNLPPIFSIKRKKESEKERKRRLAEEKAVREALS